MREVKRGRKGGKGCKDEQERKEEIKGEGKIRCRRKTGVSIFGWAWPVLPNTDIQTYTKRDGDTNIST